MRVEYKSEYVTQCGRVITTRTSLLDERTIDSFTMIREDGTRIGFKLDERHIDSAGNPAKIRLHWIVEGVAENGFASGAGNLNGDLKLSCNFGFILGNDEKVTIKANRNTYQ